MEQQCIDASFYYGIKAVSNENTATQKIKKINFRLFGSLIPTRIISYIFITEKDYVDDLDISYFGTGLT